MLPLALIGGVYVVLSLLLNLRHKRHLRRVLAETERQSQEEEQRQKAQAAGADQSTTILEALLVQPRKPRR